MKLNEISFKNGFPCKEYIHKRGTINRIYGKIKKCVVCKEKFFASFNQLKSKPGKYCTSKCRSKVIMVSHYKNGITFVGGRKFIARPSHPNSTLNKRYIQLSRLVMSEHLGRPLVNGEVVHHINGNKKDDRLENLMIFPNNGEHMRHHAKLKREAKKNGKTNL